MERKPLRAKYLLQELEELKCQVAHMQRRVIYLENHCTRTTSRYSRTAYSGSRGPGDALAQLADQKSELEKLKQQLKLQQQKLEQWLHLLPKPRWRMVLRYHYLDGLELNEVADMMSQATGHNFTMHQIYRLHAQALQAADKLWPQE